MAIIETTDTTTVAGKTIKKFTKQNTGANENIKISLTPITVYDGGNLEWM